MSSTWLGQLHTRLFGGTSSSRSARRKPTSFRPRIETLEDRTVPSASTVVSDATGTAFALDPATHHVLETVQGPGYAGWSPTSIANVSALVSDSMGDLFALRFDDHRVYEHVQGSSLDTPWNFAGAFNISSLVSDAAGDVFVLSDSWLGGAARAYELDQGSLGWNYANAYNISSLVTDNAGNVFALSFGDGHKVFELTDPSSLNWSDTGAYNISSLVSDSSGNVYALSSSGLISSSGPFGWFSEAGDDTVYVHNSQGGWSDTGAHYISTLVSDTWGNVVARSYGDSNVYNLVDGAINLTPIDTGVSQLGVSLSGNLLALNYNGVLQSASNYPTAWFEDSLYNVQTLSTDSTGRVWGALVSGSGGELVWMQSMTGDPGTWA
jgi:hypothetical protein